MGESGTTSKTVATRPRFFYGYVVVAAVFWIMALVQGLFMSFGVFFTPIINEFGWLRATLSGSYSVGVLSMGVASIVVGALGDRFGPRIIQSAGIVCFSLGHLLLSQVHSVWQMYLFYPVIGFGQSVSDVVLLPTIVRWFVKKRGLMSGIAKVGTGVGMLSMPVLITWLTARYGWREAYIILAILVLVVTLPLAQLLKRDPAETKQFSDGDNKPPEGTIDFGKQGLSFREAVRTWQFWIIFTSWLTGLFCIQSILVHITPHAIDSGIAEVDAASVLSTLGATSIAGRLVIGFAGDRIRNVRGLTVCFALFVMALIWLQFAHELWALYPFAAIWGIGQGGMITALSPAVAELFGVRAHGTLLGIVFFGGTLGGAVGPLLAGYIFDVTRSYRLDFIIMLVMALGGLLLTIALKPLIKADPPGKEV